MRTKTCEFQSFVQAKISGLTTRVTGSGTNTYVDVARRRTQLLQGRVDDLAVASKDGTWQENEINGKTLGPHPTFPSALDPTFLSFLVA